MEQATLPHFTFSHNHSKNSSNLNIRQGKKKKQQNTLKKEMQVAAYEYRRGTQYSKGIMDNKYYQLQAGKQIYVIYL